MKDAAYYDDLYEKRHQRFFGTKPAVCTREIIDVLKPEPPKTLVEISPVSGRTVSRVFNGARDHGKETCRFCHEEFTKLSPNALCPKDKCRILRRRELHKEYMDRIASGQKMTYKNAQKPSPVCEKTGADHEWRGKGPHRARCCQCRKVFMRSVLPAGTVIKDHRKQETEPIPATNWGVCPKGGKHDIWRQGKHGGRQRIACRKCDKFGYEKEADKAA